MSLSASHQVRWLRFIETDRMRAVSGKDNSIMRDKVLIVDGVEAERLSFMQMLMEDYQALEANNGELAIQMIGEHLEELAVILLKLMIPKMDGFKVLEVMNEKKWIEKVPVLIIDGAGSAGMESKCFELGAVDFLNKPFEEGLVRHRVSNAANAFIHQEQLEESVRQKNKTMERQYKLLKQQAEELRQSKQAVIDILGSVVEYRNLNNASHTKQVKEITQILAEETREAYPEYGLTPQKVQVITLASTLHDIGKITIPDTILLKPTKKTEEELEMEKSHTTKGCEIISSIQGAWDQEYTETCMDICRYHHERYDGNGYPDGLVGDAIPLSAQLVALADLYDTLVSENINKKAYSKEQAYQMIISGECGVFNPKLISVFRNAKEKIEALVEDKTTTGE